MACMYSRAGHTQRNQHEKKTKQMPWRVRVLLGCESLVYLNETTRSLWFFFAYFFALLPVCLTDRTGSVPQNMRPPREPLGFEVKKNNNNKRTRHTNSLITTESRNYEDHCTNQRCCNPLMLFLMNVIRIRRRRAWTDCFLRNSKLLVSFSSKY